MAQTKKFKALPKAAKRAAFAAMDEAEGKTVIKSPNSKKIKEGFKNPKGMMFSIDKKTRAAVAGEAHDILRKLQGKK